eukprot:TRINITY_DN29000_c0_g1_i3.p1 TRINITY_DN29000_c0_g1~~TRINITY_DN29000_c0_g1_i3.p1  ORF type:complete len:703 (-),score=177.78 TRINITY_DN29000_c0_g1_i3:17-2125(-)
MASYPYARPSTTGYPPAGAAAAAAAPPSAHRSLPPAQLAAGAYPSAFSQPSGFGAPPAAAGYANPPPAAGAPYAHAPAGYHLPPSSNLPSNGAVAPQPAQTTYTEYDYEGAGTADYYDPAAQYDYSTSSASAAPGVYACDPRFMSMTVNAIPKSQTVKLKSKIPIALLVQPLAPVEYEPRSINFGVSGVIRCRACRAYINPFVDFKENKGVWVCNLCGRQNELPSTYIQEIRNPESRANHPELTEASFEIVAPPEYTVRAPQPPTYIFMIDVSLRAISSGMLATVCQSIAASLNELPGYPRTNVGFVTFDSTVHVYCLKSTNKLPQVFVLPNVDDVYLPVPADLLVNLDECRALVDYLLDSLPRMYAENKDPENAFGPALNVATQIGHKVGGKIMCFTSGIPNQGEGSLQNRDNPRLYGTDKEHTLLQAATNHYRTKGEAMTQYHLMVDILAFPDSYMDIATLGELAQYSGGQLLYYPGFNEVRDAERVSYDIYRILTREQSWEAVFRVRASRGLKISDYYGNFFKRSQDLLAVPNSDADKAYVVEFVNEENPIPTATAAIQSALLYSNSNGERRLRIHTLVLPVAADAPELFNSINVNAMTNYIAKKAVAACRKASVQTAREIIQFQCTEVVSAFKKCFLSSKLSTLNDYPPSLVNLPLATLALLKNIAFKDGADVPIETRACVQLDLNSMGLNELVFNWT